MLFIKWFIYNIFMNLNFLTVFDILCEVKNVSKTASLHKIEQFFSQFGDSDVRRYPSLDKLTVNFQRPTHAYSSIQAVDNKRYVWTDAKLTASAELSPETKRLLLTSQGILIENFFLM